MAQEAYKTVPCAAEAEFTARRSRFLGQVKPVGSPEEAEKFIREVRAAHRDATHHVYAYVLRTGQARRYSDDGEPQGTAGIPSLNVLLQAGVTDTAVVVTRWFGGILLGTGGLARAYSRGASEALAASGIVRMAACREGALSCGYGLYGRAAPLVSAQGGAVDDSAFGGEVRLWFHIPCGSEAAFQAALADASCGSCEAEFGGVKYYRMP